MPVKRGVRGLPYREAHKLEISNMAESARVSAWRTCLTRSSLCRATRRAAAGAMALALAVLPFVARGAPDEALGSNLKGLLE